MENELMTLFANVNSKRAERLVTLEEWIQQIRTNKTFAERVERRQKLLLKGRNDEADRIKRSLPALVPAGNCQNGRKVNLLTDRTGIAPFDFDHLEAERLEEVRQELPQYPWVKAVHRTCSLDGLRVFVNVGVMHPDVYPQAYRTVADWFKKELALAYDPACKDLCRLSFAASDPEAYYTARTEVFPYPEGFSPFGYQPPTGPDFSEDHHYPVRMQQDNSAVRVSCFLNSFLQKHPFEPGRRHTTLVRMGQVARWRHLTRTDLEELKSMAFQSLGQLPMKEYTDALEWGYAHSSEAPLSYWEKVQKVQRFTNGCSDGTENGFLEGKTVPDEVDTEAEAISTAPFFEEEVVQTLPSLFLRGMTAAATHRQRDALLLGMLGILSGCEPGVRVRYANQEVSPHLYVAVLGPAAAGKGVLAYAASLAQPIHEELVEQWKKAMKEFSTKRVAWELEQRRALREKRMPDMELKPEEPARQALLVPPNTSKSQLIADLETADDRGLICYTSEMDAFTAAVATDYGKHALELRMIYHHEPVGLNYKGDGRMVYVPHPRLAICMSGTLQQLVNFVPYREDGMLSRICFYLLPSNPEWVSAEPDEAAFDLKKLFQQLGREVADLFHFLEKNPTRVTFTKEQWRIHDRLFRSLLGRVLLEDEENTQSIVNRHGLMMIRIATLLTAIRKYEQRSVAKQCICTDVDFRTALSLVQTMLVHSLRVSTMLENQRGKRKPMRVFRQMQEVLDKLPQEFTHKQFIEAAVQEGRSVSTAKRSLDKAIELQLVEKTDRNYRKMSQ